MRTRAKFASSDLKGIQLRGIKFGGATRSRTEIDGFAIRSIAILPSRLFGGHSIEVLCEIGATYRVRTDDLYLGKVPLYQLS